MIEKIEDIVAKQVEAIKNIKFDKITVWDGGAGSNGGSTTANFMKELIKALPAMHDLASQAGIELPRILGKVDNCIEDNKKKVWRKNCNHTKGIVAETEKGVESVICPHCGAKYKAKNDENGNVNIAGFNDIDAELDGQQIYCIKCGTKFTVPNNNN